MPGGRPPKPTALKMIEGNPGKRPLPQNEPQPALGPVDMLPFLSEPAQEAWGRLAPVLSDMKVLTVADAEALGMLCETAAEYWQATDVIARRGMTYEVEWYTKTGDLLKTTTEQRPEVRIRSDAAKRLKSLMEQFGLTPSARAKLTVAPAKADPLEDYLKGRKSG